MKGGLRPPLLNVTELFLFEIYFPLKVPNSPRTSFLPSSRPTVLAVESTIFCMGVFRVVRRVLVERLGVPRLTEEDAV
jgi:hypothetical protein